MRNFLTFLFLNLLLVLAWSMLPGCQWQFSKAKQASDSTSVKKESTTEVKEGEKKTVTDSTAAFFKKILEWTVKEKVGDTTINNITTPVYNYYPVRYTEETGTVNVKRDEFQRYKDSVNKAKSDSTKVETSSLDKSSKGSFLNPWMLAFIAIIILLIGRLTNKLKF